MRAISRIIYNRMRIQQNSATKSSCSCSKIYSIAIVASGGESKILFDDDGGGVVNDGLCRPPDDIFYLFLFIFYLFLYYCYCCYLLFMYLFLYVSILSIYI